MHVTQSQIANGANAVLDHQLFQGANGRDIEAPAIAVDGAETRHDATRQINEQRIGGQRLEPKYASLASDVGVEEQPELTLHRIDHPLAGLEVGKSAFQLGINTRASAEDPETRQPCDSGQRCIPDTRVQARRIGTANPPVSQVPISSLASPDVAAQLWMLAAFGVVVLIKRFDGRGETEIHGLPDTCCVLP